MLAAPGQGRERETERERWGSPRARSVSRSDSVRPPKPAFCRQIATPGQIVLVTG